MTKEEIQALKKKYGDIYALEVDGRIAYLRKPDRKIVGMASALGENDEIKIAEALLDACWLGGDEEIRTNDDLFLSVKVKLNQLIEIKEATLKKI